jgi:hypothetical protein
VSRPERRQHGPCQLGLISIVGNKFEATDIGPLAFQHEHRHGRADWNLDDLVLSRVRVAAPGLTVQNITYDKEELHRAAQSRNQFSDLASDIRDFSSKAAAGTHCDRYIVVHRDSHGIEGFHTAAVGFGVIHLKAFLIEEAAYLYVLIHIRIYDGQSFELIRDAPALTDDKSPGPFDFKNHKPVPGPVRQIEVASLPPTPQLAAKNPVFRSAIESLLVASLDKTLPELLRAK